MKSLKARGYRAIWMLASIVLVGSPLVAQPVLARPNAGSPNTDGRLFPFYRQVLPGQHHFYAASQ